MPVARRRILRPRPCGKAPDQHGTAAPGAARTAAPPLQQQTWRARRLTRRWLPQPRRSRARATAASAAQRCRRPRCHSGWRPPAGPAASSTGGVSVGACAQATRRMRPRVSRITLQRTTLLARSASCCVSSSCGVASGFSVWQPRRIQVRFQRRARGTTWDVCARRAVREAHHDAGHIRAEHVGIDVQGAEAFCEPSFPGCAHSTRLRKSSRLCACSAGGWCPKPRATRQVRRAASRYATRRGRQVGKNRRTDLLKCRSVAATP